MTFIFDENLPFEKRCETVLGHQLENHSLYRTFANTFGIRAEEVSQYSPDDIPLLPIRAFKQAALYAASGSPEIVFRSSGTTAMARSRHLVADTSLYRLAIDKGFFRHFSFDQYAVFCYTPGYADNPGSSLIWMLQHLVDSDPSGLSRFLTLGEKLTQDTFKNTVTQNKKVLLFGAAFGLFDLIEMDSEPLPEGSAIIETGGMKTHRREMTKTELRGILTEGFGISGGQLHSEYGMCELLSQCYALSGEWFEAPHWMRVTIRSADDPLRVCQPGEEGKIGIIDLANLWSCPFILTEDRGVMDERGRFRVLGRWNPDDMRGCNFLIEEEL